MGSGWHRTGRSSGSRSTSMLRATPGWRRIRPRRSSVSTIWCTEGGLTRKRVPKIDGGYVARMEDVPDLYAEPPDPARPVICLDESPVQLIGEVREPIAATPGQIELV